MEDAFRDLLISACERPAMYVGRNSLWDLVHYFAGYCHGAMDAGVILHFESRFQCWIEGRFGISHCAWNWVRILQHEYGDDLKAIKALPALYDEFRTETEGMSKSQLWKMMQERIIEKRGTDHWSPDDAETWTRPFSE